MKTNPAIVNFRNTIKSSFKLKRWGIRPHTPADPTHLPRLPLLDDVLIYILSLCDIVAVLSVSLTCKHLRSLASSKSVWLALISNLQARNFIDLPPGQILSEFSTVGLIDLAKRIVHGPQSWSKSNRSKPIAAHRVILHPDIDQLPEFRRDQVKLLPGGRFVLIFGSGVLRCWSVAEDKVIWEYGGSPDYPLIHFSATEVVDGGQGVIVIAGFSRTVDAFCCDHLVRLIHFPLSGQLAPRYIATICYGHPTLSRCQPPRLSKICGDFAIIERGHQPYVIILLKLETLLYRTFELSSVHSQIEIIGGYVVISEVDESTYQCVRIRVWNADLLLEMPIKSCDHNSNYINYCELDDSKALISDSISAGGSKFFTHHLSAHASPLQDDRYVIWLSTDTYINKEQTIIIHKYYLSPLEPSCHNKASRSLYPFVKFWWDRGDASISYAGHMTVYRHFWGILPYRGYEHGLFPLGDSIDNTHSPGQKKRLKLFRRERPLRVVEVGHDDPDSYSGFDASPQLSTYSGVLTYVTPKDVVIEFFE